MPYGKLIIIFTPQRVKYVPPWERYLHTEREKERERERGGRGGEGKVGGERERMIREKGGWIYINR